MIFVKEQNASVTKLFTEHHHKLIKQFLDFKERTLDILKKNEELEETVGYLEKSLALKSPVMEAEFATDERSALSLYDCLVPMLKEH